MPWVRHSKRADVAQKLRELAVEFDSGGATTDISEEFPAQGSALCPSSAYAVVLACLRTGANARPSAKSLVSMLRQTYISKVSEPAPLAPKKTRLTQQELRLRDSIVIMPPRSSQSKRQSSPSESPQAHTVAATIKPSQRRHASSTSATSRKALKEQLACLSPMKTDTFIEATPSTSCPSTPESPLEKASASSSAGTFVTSPRSSLAGSGSFHILADASCTSSRRASSTGRSQAKGVTKFHEFGPLPRLMASQSSDTLQNIKALWSSPNKLPQADSLANVKDFLSSPEALCGLAPDKLILLRRKLSEAQVLEESNRQALPRGMPVADNLVPLFQKPFNSWGITAGAPVSPRCALYI